MMRVLVTGGAGFIGSHLCEALVARGDQVTALDNLSTGYAAHIPDGVSLVMADVTDADALLEIVATGFDAVLHVAGQASISRSFASPETDLSVNVTGTLNVVRACREANISRLLYASSMTVYGEPDVVPTPETSPCVPVSFYGVTKYAAERFVQIAGAVSRGALEVTSLRMFNVYGERQSLDNPYQGVLAIFIGNILRGEPITIHSDGRQTRDFVYVRDVADAWLRVLDNPTTAGRVLNIGGGRETSINELADAVLAAFGHSRAEWNVRTADAQLGDQRRSAADNSALRSATGWRAETPLAEGMMRTCARAREANGDRTVSEVREPRR
jgi:UDP-glucose 4-epimerase